MRDFTFGQFTEARVSTYIKTLSFSLILLLAVIQPKMTTADATESHLTYLFDLLSRQNDSNYIRERISQLAHSLQAAHLAVLAKCDEETAISALLHDIGQILPLDIKDETRNKQDVIDENGLNVGRIGHELIGERYLRSKGWPENVCQLIGAHVIAKRYLATSSEYLASLSKASQSSLKQQGGPFTPAEKEQFERSDPILKEKVALGRFDDGAKVVGRQTRDLQEWLPVVHRVYQNKGRSSVEMTEVEQLDKC